MYKNLKARTKEELIEIIRCLENNLENAEHINSVQVEMLKVLTKEMPADEVTKIRGEVEKNIMRGVENGKESKQKRI